MDVFCQIISGARTSPFTFCYERSRETYLLTQLSLISAYDGKLDNQTKEHFYINPVYLTTIVAGSAGSREEISSGSAPKEDLAKYIEDYGSVQSS